MSYGPPFHFGTLNNLVAIVTTLWRIEDAAKVIMRAGVETFDFPCMSFEGVAHRKRFDSKRLGLFALINTQSPSRAVCKIQCEHIVVPSPICGANIVYEQPVFAR
jgi:hypothetical protein